MSTKQQARARRLAVQRAAKAISNQQTNESQQRTKRAAWVLWSVLAGIVVYLAATQDNWPEAKAYMAALKAPIQVAADE